MWEPDEQEFAVAFLVLSSVGGSVVGAIAGAFIEKNLSLPWVFWFQLILGGAVQLIHLVCNPETRSTVLLDREAKRRRKTGEDPNCYGPNEIKEGPRVTFKEFKTIVWRYAVLSTCKLREIAVLGILTFAGPSTCSSLSQSSFGSLCLVVLAML